MSDLKCDAEILINNIKSIVYKQTFRDHRTPKVYSEHFLKTEINHFMSIIKPNFNENLSIYSHTCT